tara:strand:- start:2043 stop:2768 length:726 start_codon:yes stop_codon:yes gene_type:complete
MNSICFVTGYCGPNGNALIPSKPVGYDSYYLTNNEELYNRLKDTDWIAVLVDESSWYPKELFDLYGYDEHIYPTISAKQFKVFPQLFLKKEYDYVVWSDNKINVNYIDTIKTTKEWPKDKAMLLHKHPFWYRRQLYKRVRNVQDEFNLCMKQSRNKKQKNRIVKYIEMMVDAGYNKLNEIHFQCGYIIYNLKHSNVYDIQKNWMENIIKCGTPDQITFNLIQQKFDTIGEYKYRIGKPIRK